eukprot:333275_1
MIPVFREEKRGYGHIRNSQIKMIILFVTIFTLYMLAIPMLISDIAFFSRDSTPLLQRRNRHDTSNIFHLPGAIFLSVVIWFYVYHAHIANPKRVRPGPNTGPGSRSSTASKSSGGNAVGHVRQGVEVQLVQTSVSCHKCSADVSQSD